MTGPSGLLHHIDRITRSHKRGEVEAAFVAAIHDCLDAQRTELYKLLNTSVAILVGLSAHSDGERVEMHDDGFSLPKKMTSIDHMPHLRACLDTDRPGIESCPSGEHRLVMRICDERQASVGFLVVLRNRPPDAAALEIAQGLVVLLTNVLGLLVHGETDTLTRLLNRKTFDEYLMNILANIPTQEDDDTNIPPLLRRRHPATTPREHWLGVMDIDHFKSINDRFGHLIGDEVLILMANLMRQSFRAQDKLFRFGGEEFVALLRPATFEDARRVFDRFRSRVEAFGFSQVGHVTISIGFARIGQGDTPSRVLDSADEALYWAKEHGRNQSHAYEDLIAAGKLIRPAPPVSDVELF